MIAKRQYRSGPPGRKFLLASTHLGEKNKRTVPVIRLTKDMKANPEKSRLNSELTGNISHNILTRNTSIFWRMSHQIQIKTKKKIK